MHKLFLLYLMEYIRESRRPPGRLKRGGLGGRSPPQGNLFSVAELIPPPASVGLGRLTIPKSDSAFLNSMRVLDSGSCRACTMMLLTRRDVRPNLE